MSSQDQIRRTGKCCCDTGTTIVIDEQLLEEREMWKEKYLCLQRQMAKDIGQIKQNIYTQCSTLMQTQFQNKEKQHAKIINKKNTEIQSLTSKIISLQTTFKIMTRQKQIEDQKLKQLQDQIKGKDCLENMFKTQSLRSEIDWNQKIQEDMANFRRKVMHTNKQLIEGLQTENQHLKHKLKDFQKKYQILIPEVQRLKATLNQKNADLETLEQKFQKFKRDMQKQLSDALLQKQEIQKTHTKCRGQIMKLNDKTSQLQIKIKTQKKAKNQIRVEPIYIEKPVHVQRIVEKIVSVQKVVKEYIEPQQYRDQALEHQYSKLKNQNDKIMKQLHIHERRFQETQKDYEKVIKDYQENISKYKVERQSLAKKIQELNKQLDIVYSVKNVANMQKCNQEPQTVKVYVKNDGNSQYYSTGTTIPRIMTTINSPRTQKTMQRSVSRNKTLSNSQSNRKITWK